MPVFFQQQINESTRLGIWKIEESEEFFKGNVPLHREVTHPHKRLQHLAGRFLLRYLFPDFPYELIKIADTRKPYIPDARYQFSISHCADFAAVIVSTTHRVGIDIEVPVPTIFTTRNKFLSEEEQEIFRINEGEPDYGRLTELWSAKEAVFKWYGLGGVDFRSHTQLKGFNSDGTLDCYFAKEKAHIPIPVARFDQIVLAYASTN